MIYLIVTLIWLSSLFFSAGAVPIPQQSAAPIPFDDVMFMHWAWDGVTNATGYILEYTDGTVTNQIRTSSTDYLIAFAWPNWPDRIYARVAATNFVYTSPWSSVEFFPPYPPDRVTIFILGSTNIPMSLQITHDMNHWVFYTNSSKPVTDRMVPGLTLYKKLSPTNDWYFNYWNPSNK